MERKVLQAHRLLRKRIFPFIIVVCLFISLSTPTIANAGCYDITGCCPVNPANQTVTCTIFGCHSCNGTLPTASTCPSCDCIPLIHKPCSKPKCTKRIKRRVRKYTKTSAVTEVVPSCKEPLKRIQICEPLHEEIIKCKVIFPGDLQDNLCQEFKRKLKTCEPDTCFAPYVQDPSVKTSWEIHGKAGNRCIVSVTTDDMGITNRKNKPIPITMTCEYDTIGINALIKRLNDMDKQYYHFTTCERGVGIHNCTITSEGKPIQKVKIK